MHRTGRAVSVVFRKGFVPMETSRLPLAGGASGQDDTQAKSNALWIT